MSKKQVMRISVDYLFPTGLNPDQGLLEVELPLNSTVNDLLTCLLDKYGESIRNLLVQESDGSPYVTFLVNGEQAEMEQVLQPEDKVLIMPPIAGG